MDFFLLLVIGGVLLLMWQRMQKLERQAETLDKAIQALQFSRAQPVTPAPQEEATLAAPRSASPPIPAEPPEAPLPKSESPTPDLPGRAAQAAQAEQIEQIEPAIAREMAPAARLQGDAAEPEREELTVVEHDNEAQGEPSRGFDFEYIFGKLLPIWGGGIALAIAGFFLVRWSIETGLLNQYVRVGFGFAFGIGLIGSAEGALRLHQRIADERVRQALAGAGIATLYASFYFAGSHYGMIPVWLAFGGLAAVTALAIFLSYRFGLPTAVLGLVGGFAAPVLTGSGEANLPVLATYLALVTGGLVHTGEKQGHSWLSLAAFGGALGWGAIMLLSGPQSTGDILALGSFLVAVGTLLPALMGQGVLGRAGRMLACAVATLQIAVLVDQSGYDLLAWGMYVLLAGAIAVLGWRHHRMRMAGAIAAGLAVCLLAAWPDPDIVWLTVITASLAAIFILVPLVHIVRQQALLLDWAQLAAFPAGLIVALCLQLGLALPDSQHLIMVLVCLALAVAPAIGVLTAWPKAINLNPFPLQQDPEHKEEHLPLGALLALTSVGAILLVAGLLATPAWAAPFVPAALAGAWLALFGQRQDIGLTYHHWAFALMGSYLLFATAGFAELDALVSNSASWSDAARWGATALPYGLLMLLPPGRQANTFAHCLAQVLAVVFVYGAISQIVVLDWRPVGIAAGVLGLAWLGRWRAAHASALAISALFAAQALFTWLGSSSQALLGQPMFALDAGELEASYRTVLPLALAWLGSMALSPRFFAQYRTVGWLLGAGLALGLFHIGFKQVFEIADLPSFVALGLAERTVWQALFALVGIGLLMGPRKWAWQGKVGAGFALAGLVHFLWFTAILHNPLWDAQYVAGWPVLNLLLVAYGLAIACTLALRPVLRPAMDGLFDRFGPLADGVVMVLSAGLCLSQLRHAYSAPMLMEVPLGTLEDLLRSILAIALAFVFLAIGSWKGERSWRIGSLVFMLVAVAKVFLLDAAALEGLARIASFFALGMCLIGIGWFYSRKLSSR